MAERTLSQSGATPDPARGGGARRSSREAFIATTARLLRRQGYAATGLSEIVTASGAPRGSLYFHFPGGKEELASAAIERSGAELTVAIEGVLASEPRLGAALGLLVDALAVGLERSGYADGCPVATAALEASACAPSVLAAAQGAFDAWLGALERRMVAGGLAPAQAQRRAVLVLCAIEGALLLSRTRRDATALMQVREELLALPW